MLTMADGRIYFIQSPTDQSIKIGYSTDVLDRLCALQTGSAVDLVLLADMPGTPRTEKALHVALASHRIGREWFRPHADVLAHVERAKTFPQSAAKAKAEMLPRERAELSTVSRDLIFAGFDAGYSDDGEGQRGMADDAGCSLRAVQNWFKNRTLPSLTNFVNLSRSNVMVRASFALLIIAGAYADFAGIGEEDALQVVGRHPNAVAAAMRGGDRQEQIFTEILWSESWGALPPPENVQEYIENGDLFDGAIR